MSFSTLSRYHNLTPYQPPKTESYLHTLGTFCGQLIHLNFSVLWKSSLLHQELLYKGFFFFLNPREPIFFLLLPLFLIKAIAINNHFEDYSPHHITRAISFIIHLRLFLTLLYSNVITQRDSYLHHLPPLSQHYGSSILTHLLIFHVIK